MLTSRNMEKETLYVCRKVLSPTKDDILKWCEDQEIECVKPDSLHVTLQYSKEPVDWSLGSPDKRTLTNFGSTEFKIFGSENDCLVLTFDSPALKNRHEALKEELRASWDHPEYHPHITFSYTYSGDLESLKDNTITFSEGIHLGPEIWDKVNENYIEDDT